MVTAAENDKNISADQLLAYSVLSAKALNEIYGRLRFMHYDKRFIETKVWAFICYKATRKWYYKIILKQACKSSMKKHFKTGHTSGALKVWTIFKSLGWDIDDAYFVDVFKKYYEDDHPLNTGWVV